MKLNIELTKTEVAKIKRFAGKLYDDCYEMYDDDKPTRSDKKEFVDSIIKETNGEKEVKTNFGSIKYTNDKRYSDKMIIEMNIKSAFVTGIITVYSNFISRIMLSIKEIVKFIEKYM